MSRHFFKLATTALVVGLVSACAQAGVDPATLPVKNLKVDVIFVGAGGTGLAVAVAARLAGAEVLVIEKLPMVGGSSLLRVGPLLLENPMLRSKLEARGPRPRSLSRSGSMTRSAPPRAAIPPSCARHGQRVYGDCQLARRQDRPQVCDPASLWLRWVRLCECAC